MEGRAQLLPCQTWYNSKHNWIFIFFCFFPSFLPLPFFFNPWLQSADDTLQCHEILISSVELLIFSICYILSDLLLWEGLGALPTAHIFLWQPPDCCILSLHQISSSCIHWNIVFRNNVKSQGEVALRITIVAEVEVSVTLWGRKDEVNCGIAAWHILSGLRQRF